MTERLPEVTIVRTATTLQFVKAIADAGFGDMVKAVVDVRSRAMALGGDLHSDAESTLLDAGSAQADLWGINLYPDEFGNPGWLEYDSLINIRPNAGNRSRGVDAIEIRAMIDDIVAELVQRGD